MQLEEYFNFLGPDDIRIKGHRIGIESVLYEYIHHGKTAEQIAQYFPTLTLEEVYATILYYLHNKEAVTKYVDEWLEFGRQARASQCGTNADLLERMRKVKEERLAARRAAP
jgi:uncharacterized protein (DUF433 family)